jgi:hypothetical protein
MDGALYVFVVLIWFFHSTGKPVILMTLHQGYKPMDVVILHSRLRICPRLTVFCTASRVVSGVMSTFRFDMPHNETCIRYILNGLGRCTPES